MGCPQSQNVWFDPLRPPTFHHLGLFTSKLVFSLNYWAGRLYSRLTVNNPTQIFLFQIHIKNLFWFILTDESVFMPETCGPGCETHFPKLISLKSSCLYFCYSQFRIYNAINPNSKWNWLLLYLNYQSYAHNRDLGSNLELWRWVHDMNFILS